VGDGAMKRAARALRGLALGLAGAVGLEGAFLLIGTTLLSVAAAHLSPIGPLVVVGSMCILAGLALAVPTRRD
jgi:hypothetical protein